MSPSRTEYFREYSKKYHQLHKERLNPIKRAQSKARYSEPSKRAEILKRNEEWRKKNAEKLKASHKLYRLNNLEKKRQAVRDWHKKNRHNPKFIAARRLRDRAYQQKKRALKKKATINLALILEWMKSVKAKKIVTCYWCQTDFSSKRVHFDHIIALSLGGPHEVENLCVACPKCNLSKTNKPVRTWITVGQQMLEL